MIADYGATGMTVGAHPLHCCASDSTKKASRPARLQPLKENHPVRVSGLVVARQRPGTAKGVVFVLLEDEIGVVNVILPPRIYEKHRVTVRSEPLLTIDGKLERKTGAGQRSGAPTSRRCLSDELQGRDPPIKRPETGEQDVRKKMGIDTDTAIAAMNGDISAVNQR